MTPDDLIEVARWLAEDAKTGSAKPAFRRRSVSTSYYAVFQALAELCADEFIVDRTAAEWEIVFRAMDHSQARNALQNVARESGDLSLGKISGTFVDLQADRHDADYNPSREFTALEADGWVDLAFDTIDEIARLPPSTRRMLAVRLMFKVRPNR